VWHVSSRSGVATVQTAIHLLLTYLHAQPFNSPLSGSNLVSRYQKKHSRDRKKKDSHRHLPSAATLPIYPGLGQAPNNAGLHAPWLCLHVTYIYCTYAFAHDTHSHSDILYCSKVCRWINGRTYGQTPDRCIYPSLHTMWAVTINRHKILE